MTIGQFILIENNAYLGNKSVELYISRGGNNKENNFQM